MGYKISVQASEDIENIWLYTLGLPNRGKAQLGEIVFLYPNFALRLYELRINNRED
ncbi:hypothetical protein [Arachidicoccus sp.]|jgi:hypothetical protein|uniref:hypothetical protein n=1 Tax=Arachidicoccus sp. TaxID=1872624 RepID=UPI003D20FC4F